MESNLLYRLYFAPRSLMRRVISRYPRLAGPVERGKRWLKRRVLPQGEKWVRVRRGLCEGLEMRLHFPEEAGVWLGDHEPEVQEAIAAAVRQGATVIDVGAAIGVMALGMARLVGSRGSVIAFEADPVQAARLREHAAANGFERTLQIVQEAVWSQTDAATIAFRCGRQMRTQGGVEADGIAPVLGGGDGAGELIEVPVTTLDAWCAATGAAPELIKIDVEGGEIEVLRGGERMIAKHRPLLIAEIHTSQMRDAFRAWLREHEYAAQEQVLFDPAPVRYFAWPRERMPEPWVRMGVKASTIYGVTTCRRLFR